MSSDTCSLDDDSMTLLALGIFQDRVAPLQSLLDQAVIGALRLLKADGGKIWLYAGDRLRPASVMNLDFATLRELSPHCGEGFSGLCLQNQQPIVSSDVLVDDRAAHPDVAKSLNMRGFVAVPLSYRNRAIGVLNVQDSSPRVFTDEEIQSMADYGRMVGLIIHHCTYFPKLSAAWAGQLSMISGSIQHPTLEPYGSDPTVVDSHPSTNVLQPGMLPKTLHVSTLNLIYQTLNDAKVITCEEASRITGLSVVTVRRYLSYLADVNLVTRELAYGKRGRPKQLYTPGSVRLPISRHTN